VVLVFVVMQKHMVAMVPSLFLAMGVIVVVLVYMFSTNLMSGSKKQGFFAFIL
jgi:hypothetical protein